MDINKKRILSAPLDITLELTGKCNLHCRHCLSQDSWEGNGELSTLEWLRLIGELREAKVFSLFLSGGEPLLREDFFILLDELEKLPFILSMGTNGTLITREVAKDLRRYRLRVQVSLDGASSHTHDRMRGERSFDKTMEGIENLKREKVPFSLSAIITKLNYQDINPIVELGKRMGAISVKIGHPVFIGEAWKEREKLALSPEEHREALRAVKEIIRKSNGYVQGSYPTLINMLKDMGKSNGLNTLTIPPCGAGMTKLAIKADGTVIPCEQIRDVELGNIRKESLKELWHNSLYLKPFRESISIPLDSISECKGCPYIRVCFGNSRCTLKTKIENKNLYCLVPDRDGGFLDEFIK